MTQICKICHTGIMKCHSELFWWLKCNLCAYSEFRQEDYDNRGEAQVNSDKLARRPELPLSKKDYSSVLSSSKSLASAKSGSSSSEP